MFTQLINERRQAEQKIMDQLTELQRWQQVTLGRENRFQELKREVNELCHRLHEAPRYPAEAAAKKRLAAETLAGNTPKVNGS